MKIEKINKRESIIFSCLFYLAAIIIFITTLVWQIKVNNLTEEEFLNLPDDKYAWALVVNTMHIDTLHDFSKIVNSSAWLLYILSWILILATTVYLIDNLHSTSPVDRTYYKYILEMSEAIKNADPSVLKDLQAKLDQDYDLNLISKDIYYLFKDMIKLKSEGKDFNNLKEF